MDRKLLELKQKLNDKCRCEQDEIICKEMLCPDAGNCYGPCGDLKQIRRHLDLEG